MLTVVNNNVDNNYTAQHWSGLLIELGEAQDRFIFKRLYEHFAPKVKQYLLGLGCINSIAEEITQETFIRVYQRAQQFDNSKAQASTWIFRIARNLLIDHSRKKSELTMGEQTYDYLEDPNAKETFCDQKKIKQLIDNLPLEQAQVIHLCYFLGLSHSQIANRLNMPIGTVKSNVRLAFKKLRTALEVTL